MTGHLFTESMLATMTTPEQWTVVIPECPPPGRLIEDPRYQEWMSTHSHAHPYPEILFVLSGYNHFGYEGRVYAIQPGDILFVTPQAEHDYFRPPWVQDYGYLWCALVGQSIIVILARGNEDDCELDRFVLPFGDPSSPKPSLFTMNFAETVQLPPGCLQLQLVSLVAALTSALIQWDHSPRGAGKAGFQSDIIRAIESHIWQTAGRGDTLEHLAYLSGYSKYHFLRLFRAYTGYSVKAYIDRCRWETTQEMLQQGRTRKEISETLGFSHPNAFYRWYQHIQQRKASETR